MAGEIGRLFAGETTTKGKPTNPGGSVRGNDGKTYRVTTGNAALKRAGIRIE